MMPCKMSNLDSSIDGFFFPTPYFSGALSSGGTATGTSEQLEEAGLSEASML